MSLHRSLLMVLSLTSLAAAFLPVAQANGIRVGETDEDAATRLLKLKEDLGPGKQGCRVTQQGAPFIVPGYGDPPSTETFYPEYNEDGTTTYHIFIRESYPTHPNSEYIDAGTTVCEALALVDDTLKALEACVNDLPLPPTNDDLTKFRMCVISAVPV